MDIQLHDIWIDFHQELQKFIYSKVKDADLSNDLLQDVFLKIHLHIHTLADSSKLTSWVYQITRNTVADYFRTNQVKVQISDFDFAEQDYDEPLYQSLSRCVNMKISQLSEKYKQAILLTTFKDYSQLALADELGISYSGAKTRVQRAREQLKEMIINCDNVVTDKEGNVTEYQSAQKQ